MSIDRAVAWDRQLREVHRRLRAAMALAREALGSDEKAPDAAADLLLVCVGFCAALDGHHRSEDAGLFPDLLAQHPDLSDVVDSLMRDHAMLAHLLGAFRAAAESGADTDALTLHLDGIDAIMESHFGYEERALLPRLAALRTDASPTTLLGAFAE